MPRQSIVVNAFETKLGWAALAGRNDTVLLLVIGRPSQTAALRDMAAMLAQEFTLGSWNPTLAQRICRYAEGVVDTFVDIELDLAHLTEFQAKVLRACRDIGYGDTRSYGELAVLAGSPGAARAVGNTMAANRFPLIVPCHRVVGAGGALGGFSAPQGTTLKRHLLDMEAQVSAVGV